ncbi:MAG: RdgB/HAM1 family non-canonical purine NTP pyrophosphatase [Rickettsiales bacterium]|nr:RdgB/HAM1 family non-canonical purine NTP pyrophosphatase [Rickettsiales bacterium]
MTFKLPKEILIATGNKGKFVEIAQLLEQVDIKAISTSGLDISEPEETGLTFAENSLLKAKYYASKTNLVALADDSGLCIEALNGAPGIHSARFAKNDEGKTDFNFAFAKIVNLLKEKNSSEKSRAHFICNLAIFDPKTNFEISFEGRVDGILTFPPQGNKGFGYDPIFIKDGMKESFGEIDPKTKDQISHRGEAFRKLLDWFKES